MVRVPVGREYGGADSVRPEDVVKFRLLDLLSTALVSHADEPGFAVQGRRGRLKAWFVGEDARRVETKNQRFFVGLAGVATVRRFFNAFFRASASVTTGYAPSPMLTGWP